MQTVSMLASWVEGLSIVILLLGLAAASITGVRAGRGVPGTFVEIVSGPVLHAFRMTLGRFILLSLEVLIVSDILRSVIHRTLDEVVYLAGIVVIRVMLAFFLDHEVQRAEALEAAQREKNKAKDNVSA